MTQDEIVSAICPSAGRHYLALDCKHESLVISSAKTIEDLGLLFALFRCMHVSKC